jgi:hypothetical protein
MSIYCDCCNKTCSHKELIVCKTSIKEEVLKDVREKRNKDILQNCSNNGNFLFNIRCWFL